jgi:hypothetical protein
MSMDISKASHCQPTKASRTIIDQLPGYFRTAAELLAKNGEIEIVDDVVSESKVKA